MEDEISDLGEATCAFRRLHILCSNGYTAKLGESPPIDAIFIRHVGPFPDLIVYESGMIVALSRAGLNGLVPEGLTSHRDRIFSDEREAFDVLVASIRPPNLIEVSRGILGWAFAYALIFGVPAAAAYGILTLIGWL